MAAEPSLVGDLPQPGGISLFEVSFSRHKVTKVSNIKTLRSNRPTGSKYKELLCLDGIQHDTKYFTDTFRALLNMPSLSPPQHRQARIREFMSHRNLCENQYGDWTWHICFWSTQDNIISLSVLQYLITQELKTSGEAKSVGIALATFCEALWTLVEPVQPSASVSVSQSLPPAGGLPQTVAASGGSYSQPVFGPRSPVTPPSASVSQSLPPAGNLPQTVAASGSYSQPIFGPTAPVTPPSDRSDESESGVQAIPLYETTAKSVVYQRPSPWQDLQGVVQPVESQGSAPQEKSSTGPPSSNTCPWLSQKPTARSPEYLLLRRGRSPVRLECPLQELSRNSMPLAPLPTKSAAPWGVIGDRRPPLYDQPALQAPIDRANPWDRDWRPKWAVRSGEDGTPLRRVQNLPGLPQLPEKFLSWERVPELREPKMW